MLYPKAQLNHIKQNPTSKGLIFYTSVDKAPELGVVAVTSKDLLEIMANLGTDTVPIPYVTVLNGKIRVSKLGPKIQPRYDTRIAIVSELRDSINPNLISGYGIVFPGEVQYRRCDLYQSRMAAMEYGIWNGLLKADGTIRASRRLPKQTVSMVL